MLLKSGLTSGDSCQQSWMQRLMYSLQLRFVIGGRKLLQKNHSGWIIRSTISEKGEIEKEDHT